MPRPSPSPVLRALLAASALAAGAGCADNEISVYIRRIQSPTLMGTTCSYGVDPTTPAIPEGTLDLAFKHTYRLAPLLQNNISMRADMMSNRIESNLIRFEGFIVELREDSPDGPLVTGPDFSNPFTVYQSNIVLPGPPGQPGYGAAPFEAIPLQIGDALYNEVCVRRRGEVRSTNPDCPVSNFNLNVTKRLMLRVAAFGRTGGGVAVETPRFNFPVTVCCGCLRFFPPAMATEPDSGMGSTCSTAMTVMNEASCPGVLGQDYPVPCGLCSASTPSICQPPGFSARMGVTCR